MRSRLAFLRALQHDPGLLFLDEPTSGLDPSNSRVMKDMILEEKEKGKTIILTTHNMHDAAELCDRVAFIVNGRVCALDTPHNLIMGRGQPGFPIPGNGRTAGKGGENAFYPIPRRM